VRIGPYEIVRELGRGGMGVVYEVSHPAAPRRLALKLILDDGAPPDELERFRREARLLARVRHPSVVVVHALDRTEDGRDYLVTDLIEGESLGRAARQQPFEPRRSAEIARDLALAVEEVHKNGILHRDLKPDNVILTPDGVPVLLDFGLARDAGAERLTQTGVVIGTPAYMPPEQAEGARATAPLDERADVYSLGATLFFLLAGVPPFDGATTAQLLYSVLEKEPGWPAGAPRDLVAIGKKAMAKARDARYARAADLAADLDLFLQGRRPAAASGSRAPLVAAVVAAVVFAAGAALALSRGGTSTPAPAAPVASSASSPTAVAEDRPPPDDSKHPLSSYRRQRAWVRAHAGDPRAAGLARQLKERETAKQALATCAFRTRPKCFWVGATTLLVLHQKEDGPFVVDMDKPSPIPVPLVKRIDPKVWGFFSGALWLHEGSVRFVVGAEKNVFVFEGDAREPEKLIARRAFVFPDSAESTIEPTKPQRCMAVAISPDGKTAAAGGDWHEAYLIDLEHPDAPPRPLRPKQGSTVLSLAFTANRLLVVNQGLAEMAPGLTVFDLDTEKQVGDERSASDVTSLALARDGRFAMGTSDGDIKVESLGSPTETVTLQWPKREWARQDEPTHIRGLAFVEGGARLVAVSGADDPLKKGARLFTRSSRSANEPARLLAHGLDAMVSLSVSEDELLVATGAFTGLVEVRPLPD
jgi:hypothetical protein